MFGVGLGGGGARGAAHLGVLKYLANKSIKIDCIAGTSAGSIIATLFAFGVPVENMIEDISQLKPASASGLRWGDLGLMENTHLRKLLEKHLGMDARIEQAKVRLGIHVTNVETGVGEDLLEGPVIEAVLASCCVPALYVPPQINGTVYVDGGLTENVPYQALKLLGASTTLGVNLNGQASYQRPEGAMDVLMNAMDIAIDSQTRRQLESFDEVISIDLTGFSRTSAEATDELVKKGYAAAQNIIHSSMDIRFMKLKGFWRFLKG